MFLRVTSALQPIKPFMSTSSASDAFVMIPKAFNATKSRASSNVTKTVPKKSLKPAAAAAAAVSNPASVAAAASAAASAATAAAAETAKVAIADAVAATKVAKSTAAISAANARQLKKDISLKAKEGVIRVKRPNLRAPSAFTFLVTDMLKSKAPGKAPSSVFTDASAEWKKLSEAAKKPYFDRAAANRVEFYAKKDENFDYYIAHRSKAQAALDDQKNKFKPKAIRSPSAYCLFLGKLMRDSPKETVTPKDKDAWNKKRTEHFQLIASKWKELSDEEKKPFVNRAAELKVDADKLREARKKENNERLQKSKEIAKQSKKALREAAKHVKMSKEAAKKAKKREMSVTKKANMSVKLAKQRVRKNTAKALKRERLVMQKLKKAEEKKTKQLNVAAKKLFVPTAL